MRILDYRQLVDTFFRRAAIESIAIELGMSGSAIPVDFRCIMPEANCIKTSICIPFLGINPANGHRVFVLYFWAYKLQREDDFLNILNNQLEPDHVHGPRYLPCRPSV